MGEDESPWESPWRRHRNSWVPKLRPDPLEVAIYDCEGGGGGLPGGGETADAEAPEERMR